MFDYEAILEENPNGVLATQDGDKVKTRVFQYLFSIEGNPYFCTSNKKPVYEQLMAHSQVSFCTFPSNFAPVTSVNGRAVFVDNHDLKVRAFDENPAIKDLYETPENPVFEIFYIGVEEIETFNFEEGPKTYTL